MEERTKIARDLDDKEDKSWKLCVGGKRVLIISTIGGMLFCESEQLELHEGRAPARVAACWRCFLLPLGK